MAVRGAILTAIVATSFAVSAQAATYPTFTLDTAASSIHLTYDTSCTQLSCATVTGSFGAGATGFNWTPTADGQTIDVDDFFHWTVSGFGLEHLNVAVQLAFTSPSSATGGGTGTGFVKTLFGVLSGGALTWSAIDPIDFADGSRLDIAFESLHGFWLGHHVSSGASFTAQTPEVPAVPLPASIPLLGAALLALAALGRRRTAA